MGLEADKLDPDSANTLDEMAAAMLDENVHYAEEHLAHGQDIPTFHVVHSGSDNE